MAPSTTVLPHSTDRTYEDSGYGPPGQQYKRTKDLRVLCPASPGLESEPYRTSQRLGWSGPLTPGSEDWLATHIQKLRGVCPAWQNKQDDT